MVECQHDGTTCFRVEDTREAVFHTPRVVRRTFYMKIVELGSLSEAEIIRFSEPIHICHSFFPFLIFNF